MNRMTSSLLAGVISAVIWTVISLLTGMPGGAVALWAVVLLVVVTAITYGISTVIAASKARGRA